jgi:hypothetical protein
MTLENHDRPRKRRGSAIGHALAVLSLLCCLSFWLVMAYYRWKGILIKDLVGSPWFLIMCTSLVSALLAARLRSRLCWIAIPVSIFMMIVTM